MPHLQFEINAQLNSSQKKTFNKIILSEFSRIMKTGTDHIAISIREFSQQSLTLGRAEENDIVCLMNLDIRSGRTNKQKKQLIESYTNAVSEIFGVKKKINILLFLNIQELILIFMKKVCKIGLKTITRVKIK